MYRKLLVLGMRFQPMGCKGLLVDRVLFTEQF